MTVNLDLTHKYAKGGYATLLGKSKLVPGYPIVARMFNGTKTYHTTNGKSAVSANLDLVPIEGVWVSLFNDGRSFHYFTKAEAEADKSKSGFSRILGYEYAGRLYKAGSDHGAPTSGW